MKYSNAVINKLRSQYLGQTVYWSDKVKSLLPFMSGADGQI